MSDESPCRCCCYFCDRDHHGACRVRCLIQERESEPDPHGAEIATLCEQVRVAEERAAVAERHKDEAMAFLQFTRRDLKEARGERDAALRDLAAARAEVRSARLEVMIAGSAVSKATVECEAARAAIDALRQRIEGLPAAWRALADACLTDAGAGLRRAADDLTSALPEREGGR